MLSLEGVLTVFIHLFILFYFIFLHDIAGTPPTGWKMQAATNNGVKGDCKTQVCAETEVCVRTPPPQNGHVCVPVPADCGVPGVSGGSLQWNGTQQNDVAILTCDSGYELISAASNQLTCNVTSHWTPSTVTCIRVYAFFLFLSPRLSSRLFF